MVSSYSKHDPPEVRFWAKVDKGSSRDNCWNWVGGKNDAGYGTMTIMYKSIYVHRFSYELHFGPIPKGFIVCHHCDNKACVNPSHLFFGTYKDNMQDMIAKGRERFLGPKKPRCGENHPMAKLTQEDVDSIRALYATGKHTVANLGRKFNTPKSNVNLIVNWRTWRTKDSPDRIYPGRKDKLTKKDVQNIRSEYAKGNIFQRELAAQHGVSRTTISLVVNHKRHP